MKTLIASVALAIALAAPAHADGGGDQEFLRWLDTHGVVYLYARPAIDLANDVCIVIARNPTHSRFLEIQNWMISQGATAYEAEMVTVGAIGAYCPQYGRLVRERQMLR